MSISFILSVVSFAQIDWHDFVVVETVEFKDNEMGKINDREILIHNFLNGERHIQEIDKLSMFH